MKEDGIWVICMGRESGSIKMEAKKLDSGLIIKDKESLNAMIRVEHLLTERFMRMTKKLSVKKLNRRYKGKGKERKGGKANDAKPQLLIASQDSLLIVLNILIENLFNLSYM